MKYIKTVFLLLLLSSCTTLKIEGHWESNKNGDAVVIGLLVKSDRKCVIYVAPPNHSTFVGNCEYKQIGAKLAVYEIPHSGKRSKKHLVFQYNKEKNTLNLVNKDKHVILYKKLR